MTFTFPRISFGMIVLNGEPFIKYNLESLYPHAHEIIVVEGAVEKFCHAATPDGHSVDNTAEIIRHFPDPENKIKLIQREGFWPEKDEMANAYMKECTGDYIWQVDVDEFYKADDIKTIRAMLASDPEITQVNIRSVGFWRSFRARVMGASLVLGADEFIRIFCFRPGYRYVTHRPPTLADEMGRHFEHKKVIRAAELEQKGIIQYHYSYVFPEYVAGKAHYYSQMQWGQGHEDGLHWFSQEWMHFANPLRVHIIKYPPSWIVPFNEDHPPIIHSMLKDIAYKETPELLHFLKSDFLKYKMAGEVLTELISEPWKGRVNLLKNIFKIMFIPRSLRDIRAIVTIWQTTFRIVRERTK